MATALILDDSQAEELDEVGFQRSAPQQTLSSEFERRRALTHYGCSPAFDIDVRDRNVLPAEQGLIRAGNLVEFAGVPAPAEAGGGEPAPPDVELDSQGRPLPGVYRGPAGRAGVPQKMKQPGDCAEEIRWAYGDANPWGFRVFDALTGLDPDDAFRVFKSVLPRRMSLPEMVAHLEGLGEMDDPAAESVRLQLLTGCGDAATFARETLDGSIQERADRLAGSQGKAKFDRRDERLAGALGERLPDMKPVPVTQQPQVVQAGPDPAVLDTIRQQAEEIGRLKGLQEARASKAPKAAARKTA